jgi:low affinity Fe/Cu permease
LFGVAPGGVKTRDAGLSRPDGPEDAVPDSSTLLTRAPIDRKRFTVPRDFGQAQLSRSLRALDALTSKAGTATAIAVVVGVAVAGLAVAGFSSPWTSAFSVSAAGITLVMVFVIQHTQSREQTATQLKLDEIIRALPQADDHLVHVEAAKDEELEDLERRQTAHHQSLRTDEERR